MQKGASAKPRHDQGKPTRYRKMLQIRFAHGLGMVQKCPGHNPFGVGGCLACVRHGFTFG